MSFLSLSEDKITNWALLWNQVLALMIKRFHHVRRDKVAFLCEIVLPAAFILLAMAFALAVPPVSPQPALELQPWMYEPGVGSDHLTTFYRSDSKPPINTVCTNPCQLLNNHT